MVRSKIRIITYLAAGFLASLAVLAIPLAQPVYAAPLSAAEVQAEAEKPANCGDGSNARSVACRGGFKAGYAGDPTKAVKCSDVNYNTPQEISRCEAGYDAGRALAVSRGEGGGGGSGGSAAANAAQDKCDGGSFSWIICPILETIQDAVVAIETDIIEPFLNTDPLRTDSDLYRVWDTMRTLANVMFVLVFLVIIFANVLSINISAYAVKKMLPRIVAAVILVQFSFFFMSLAIDITNIFGKGIFLLIDGLTNGFTGSPGAGSGATLGLAGAFVGVAAVGAVLSGTIFIVVVTAFFGVLAVFFTLLFRQILITLLIIVAPIALVAWVLPNTKKFFDIWSETFIKILLMYPIIMLLFASGKLFANAAGNIESIGEGFRTIATLISTIAPLFLVPATFKLGGSLFAKGVGAISNRTGGYKDKFSKSQFAQDRQAKKLAIKRDLAAGGGLDVFGKRLGANSRVMRGVGRIATGDPGGSHIVGNFNKSLTAAKKTLEERGLDTQDASVLLAGTDADFKAALTSSNPNKKLLAQQLKQYRGSSAFRAQAALNAAETGIATRKVRKYIQDSMGGNQLLGSQLFNKAAVKNIDKSPDGLYTDYNSGTVDQVKLVDFMRNKQPSQRAGMVESSWGQALGNTTPAGRTQAAKFEDASLIENFSGRHKVGDKAGHFIQEELKKRQTEAMANEARLRATSLGSTAHKAAVDRVAALQGSLASRNVSYSATEIKDIRDAAGL